MSGHGAEGDAGAACGVTFQHDSHGYLDDDGRTRVCDGGRAVPDAEKDAPIERVVIHIQEPPPPRPVGPCLVTRGPHRWAWLTAGGQACGFCGRPR